MDWVLDVCRFVQFTAAMVVFGSSAFRFYALSSDVRMAGEFATFDAKLDRIISLTAILALVSALALLLCQSAMMAGAPSAALDVTTTTAVLFETHFGRVWVWHLLIAASLVLICLGGPRRRPIATLVFSLLLLASLGWTGHAAMGEGPVGTARELNQTAHLLAAGLWLGGLVPLRWLLRSASAAQDEAGLALTRDAVRHFSQMGYVAVAVIALTGAINTVLLVGSLDAMFDTAYGRLLASKILLFLAMAVVALVNRFRLAPRVYRDPAALGALCRTVGLEQLLGLCILAVVSVLGTWPPALHAGR